MVVELTAESAGVVLSLEDVEALLGADARAVLRDPSAARTLLLRMRATLRHDAGEMKRLRTDVARMAEVYRMKSSPLAAAVEALGRLSPEEQAEVFSIHATGVLEALREQMAQARTVRLGAVSARRRTRLVLAGLLERGQLCAADAAVVAAELEVLAAAEPPPIPDVVLPPIPDPVAVPAAGTELQAEPPNDSRADAAAGSGGGSLDDLFT